MTVLIYDIAKQIGIERKEVLARARALGITAAKVPSSSLDKITAEYLENELGGVRPPPAAPAAPAHPPEPVFIVAPPAEVPAAAPPAAEAPSPPLTEPVKEVAPTALP